MKIRSIISINRLQYCGLLAIILLLIPLEKASALTIAPERIDAELLPGESLIRNIKIYNEWSHTVLVSPELSVIPTPLLKDGEAVEIGTEVPKRIEAAFLSYNPDSFRLAPGAWIDFPLEIKVPVTLVPGGYYGALLFQFIEESSTENGTISVLGKVGPILLLSVIGPVRATAEFVELRALGRGGGIFDHLPQSASFTLKNTGDVHVVPHGTLTITNWWGRTRERVEVNVADRVLLPGWTRTFEESIGRLEPDEQGLVQEWKNFGLGPYRLELDLSIGNRTVQRGLAFWVIPWRLLGLGALVLAILLALRSMVALREHRIE